MTDLLRFLLDGACYLLLFLASCARAYCKIPRRRRSHCRAQHHHHHRMAVAATAAVPTTPPSAAASPGGPWSNKRAAAAGLVPGDPSPAAKRPKDVGQMPAPPTTSSGGVVRDNGNIGAEREYHAGGAGPAAPAPVTGPQRTSQPMDHMPLPVAAAPAEEPKKGAAAPGLLLRRRPSLIVIPEQQSASSAARREFELEAAARRLREEQHAAGTASGGCSVAEGDGYCVASRKGTRRPAMEDGHAAITRVDGDPNQAYFGVFDGHGGRAAVDFVARNLGRNVVAALRQAGVPPAEAIRGAYAATDRDFVSQKLPGGACVGTVVLKDGALYAANAGDCRVVLSRGGRATVLTSDHRAGREDERQRVESSGGFVSCYGGGAVWRVQDSLSVTRSIGDAHLKQWVIPDPEVTAVRLLQGASCIDGDDGNADFLILASDGLWDHVANQEAVDVVLANGGCGPRAARALADAPFARGGRDDVTVMLVRLRGFVE